MSNYNRNDFSYREKGFNGYEMSLLEKKGFTPESAKAFVIEKLKKFNISDRELSPFLVPAEELRYGEREVILCLSLSYPDEPDNWCKRTNRDLSDVADYHSFYWYLDS